jgi:serine/threonine protein kinase
VTEPAADPPPPDGDRRAPLLEAGQVVGRYKVLKRIGAGAMGEVFLATDEELGRRAAIKVLGQKHLGNPVIKERFVREARALARLSHTNLITVYEAGHVGEGQRPYFAMELLEGGDTQKLLEEHGPLPSGVVALIGAQAAAGLAHAARAGVIHRDVKPANLGISAHGTLKVTDFGLAKSVASDKSLTGEGFVVGTADYIAPEQARGEELDQRADVYALGCTLFHLATGRPPFRSAGATHVERYADVMRSHLHVAVPDPRKLVPGTDGALAALMMRLMNKDRGQRPTFEDLAADLGKLATKLKGELPRVTRRPFTLPAGVDTVTPAARPPAPLWPRVAGAAILLAGAAPPLVAYLRHRAPVYYTHIRDHDTGAYL